jgi:hypothetical protein
LGAVAATAAGPSNILFIHIADKKNRRANTVDRNARRSCNRLKDKGLGCITAKALSLQPNMAITGADAHVGVHSHTVSTRVRYAGVNTHVDRLAHHTNRGTRTQRKVVKATSNNTTVPTNKVGKPQHARHTPASLAAFHARVLLSASTPYNNNKHTNAAITVTIP